MEKVRPCTVPLIIWLTAWIIILETKITKETFFPEQQKLHLDDR